MEATASFEKGRNSYVVEGQLSIEYPTDGCPVLFTVKNGNMKCELFLNQDDLPEVLRKLKIPED